MPVRAVCKPHSPDLKRGALATDARGCSLWRSLLERLPPAPESWVRDPLGELVRTRFGGCYTSNRDNRTLERIVKQNAFKNVGEIHKEWTAAGVSASWTTTHRRMQDMGFSCRIPCVKPLLNNKQRQKHLAWAKDKKDWTAAEWSKVMFSDESKFCISFGNQGPRVWRKRGEAQNPRCLRSSVKFPQSVMVWGAMSSAGVGPLCFLRSKVHTAVYQEVLEHFMLPAADQLNGDADFIFQQNLHTVPKLPVPGLRTMVSLFLIGQQTRLTLTP